MVGEDLKLTRKNLQGKSGWLSYSGQGAEWWELKFDRLWGHYRPCKLGSVLRALTRYWQMLKQGGDTIQIEFCKDLPGFSVDNLLKESLNDSFIERAWVNRLGSSWHGLGERWWKLGVGRWWWGSREMERFERVLGDKINKIW